MSFGWSAGDIAAAISVAYNLIQALDSVDGAASDYREAVAFLRDLKRTLEPLQTFTAWNAYPAYGKDIGEQVGHIKEPVENFLAAVLKYEPGLGAKAKEGHHRHVLRKWQWYMFMSKKVLSLRRRIESHMRVIDALMQRLLLDVVWTTQQQLPDTLRTTFQETLQPELISILRASLPSPDATLEAKVQELQCTSVRSDETLVAKLSEHCQEISLGIEEIKQEMSSSKLIQWHIESSLPTRQIAPPGLEHPCSLGQNSSRTADPSSSEMVRKSLQEVYYLVFLYLGYFLQNIFLALSRLVQPSRALMPTLLAKYNISFLDAIGRQLRVLPYEYFRSFKVLQAFIQHEFKDLPGSRWVDRGRYLVLSLANNRALDEQSWSRTITPGATVAMSMVVHKRFDFFSFNNEELCPESNCSGRCIRKDNGSWVTCPACQKEVFHRTVSEGTPSRNHYSSGRTTSVSTSVSDSRPSSYAEETAAEVDEQLDEEEISLFKRIVTSERPIRPKGGGFDYESYKKKCQEMPIEQLQEELETIVRHISGGAASAVASDLFAPIIAGASFSGLSLSTTHIQNARKREIIDGGLQVRRAIHPRGLWDMMTPRLNVSPSIVPDTAIAVSKSTRGPAIKHAIKNPDSHTSLKTVAFERLLNAPEPPSQFPTSSGSERHSDPLHALLTVEEKSMFMKATLLQLEIEKRGLPRPEQRPFHRCYWTWGCCNCAEAGMPTNIIACLNIYCQHTRCGNCPLGGAQRTP